MTSKEFNVSDYLLYNQISAGYGDHVAVIQYSTRYNNGKEIVGDIASQEYKYNEIRERVDAFAYHLSNLGIR